MANKTPTVIRFRVLDAEHDRVRLLADWRQKRDVSEYLRWVLDREWAAYQRQARDRAA